MEEKHVDWPSETNVRAEIQLMGETLCRSVEDVGVNKKLERIEVQETGGFQNAYIFADREKIHNKDDDDATIITTDWNRNRRQFPTWNGGRPSVASGRSRARDPLQEEEHHIIIVII